jgi:hypothetical protein
LALCRGLGVSLWSLLLIDRLRLLRLLGLCLALKQVGKLRWARNVGWPTLWSRLGLLWLWRLRVTLGSRLGRIALGLLWLCVLRLLRRLLLGRLGIPLRSLLACKGAILCLGYSRNTAGQDRLFLAGIDLLRVKRNIELDTRLAAVVSFVLAKVKCSVCFL